MVFTLHKWSGLARECMTLPYVMYILKNLTRRLPRHGGGKTEAEHGLKKWVVASGDF